MTVIGKWTWRYKSRKLINFKIDYILCHIKPKTTTSILWKQIVIKPKLECLWLSVNSNIYYLDDNTSIQYKYYPWLDSKYKSYFEIVDRKTNTNLAFILIAQVLQKSKWFVKEFNSIFEVSWQGLILRNLLWYRNLLNRFWFDVIKFKRVDLCMDLEIDINYLWLLIKHTVIWPNELIPLKTHHPIITKRHWLETLYIWERNQLKNTYKLIRIYNKILDTKKKNKSFLYPEFEKKKNVTRIEIELRRDKAKFLDFDKLCDPNYLYRIFVHEVYPLNFQFFKFITLDKVEALFDFYMVEKNDWCTLWEGMRTEAKQRRLELLARTGKEYTYPGEEKKTVQTFISYWKKILLNWKSQKQILEILCSNSILPENLIDKQKFVLKDSA